MLVPARIREATVADAEAIARVQVAGWHAAYRGLLPDAVLDAMTVPTRTARWREILGAPSRGAATLVLIADDGVRGFASTGPSRDPDAAGAMELFALYVAPSSWRRGLGAALLGAALGRLAAAGASAVTLWVLADNRGARRFYEAMGFAADGAVKREAAHGAADHLRYRAAL